MRVATLLPAATELVCAIGARDLLVGISHECDFPAGLDGLPRLTSTPLHPELDSAAIDAAVRALVAAGRPVIGVEAATLLAARPELLVTQMLCEVCAVGDGSVRRAAQLLQPAPDVLALQGRTLAGLAADIVALGDRLGHAEGAAQLNSVMAAAFAAVRARAPAVRRRVLVVEWLAPLFLAGHWTPELVALAGGTDVVMQPGQHSVPMAWADVTASGADLVIVALCGFDVPRIRRELATFDDAAAQAWLATQEVWLLDGHQYTSRPGPRLTEAAARIQAALRGEPAPGLERWRPA